MDVILGLMNVELVVGLERRLDDRRSVERSLREDIVEIVGLGIFRVFFL